MRANGAISAIMQAIMIAITGGFTAISVITAITAITPIILVRRGMSLSLHRDSNHRVIFRERNLGYIFG
jgi:hypothetical protein